MEKEKESPETQCPLMTMRCLDSSYDLFCSSTKDCAGCPCPLSKTCPMAGCHKGCHKKK